MTSSRCSGCCCFPQITAALQRRGIRTLEPLARPTVFETAPAVGSPKGPPKLGRSQRTEATSAHLSAAEMTVEDLNLFES
jgi:hypothetical protein